MKSLLLLFCVSIYLSSCATIPGVQERNPTSLSDNKTFFINESETALRIRWDLIDQESKEIFANFHIFDPVGVGAYSLAKLCLKAQQGVKVRLVIDGLRGSIWGFKIFDGSLLRIINETCRYKDQPMFDVRFWNPVEMNKLVDPLQEKNLRRNHDKIIYLSSLKTVYEGDRNWQNVNFRQDSNRPGVSYFSVDTVVTGPLSEDVKEYLEEVWTLLEPPQPKEISRSQEFTPVRSSGGGSPTYVRKVLTQLEYYPDTYKENRRDFLDKLAEVSNQKVDYGSTKSEKTLWATQGKPVENIRFLHFSPSEKLKSDDQSMNNTLIELIANAKFHLLISTPFLMLPEEFFTSIKQATQRGVKVELLTSRPDSILVPKFYHFQNRDIKRLQDIGVNILMNTGIDNLHVKAIIADEEKTYVGTHNFNMRSADLDLESGFLFSDQKLSQELLTYLLHNSQTYKMKINKAHYILSPLIKPLLMFPYLKKQF